MKNAIIIGASSGIGAALAVDLSAEGYQLGLLARRTELLDELATKLPDGTLTSYIDVAKVDDAKVDDARERLSKLISQMGSVDLFVISSGIGFRNPELDWSPEIETIQTNVAGFAAMANVAAKHLEARGTGQLVGLSSIAALRGNRASPAYGASKAFVSCYLQALRHRFAHKRLPISVTDIQPGFVDTAMAQGDGLFWVAPVKVASKQIVRAIKRRRSHAYITRRWRLIAWLIRCLPNCLYHRT